MATDGVLTTRVPGWPLALFRIAYGLLYLDMVIDRAMSAPPKSSSGPSCS